MNQPQDEDALTAIHNLINKPHLIKENVVNIDDGIIFNLKDQPQLLKITKDGFYVRGKKVSQDDENEAKIIYDTFVAWLKEASNTNLCQ